MKNIFYSTIIAIALATSGCQMNEIDDSDRIIIEPPQSRLISKDSITFGDYLGIGIQQDAAAVYPTLQSFQSSKNLTFINVVSNFSSDIALLQNQIPLYSYIVFDQKEGTDSGVQLTMEDGKVKVIYLNSGKKLTQWPEKLKTKEAISVGEPTTELYKKFISIREKSDYARKFERILFATKDLRLAYDPEMTKSPQWYFAYTTGAKTWEQVSINFKNGKVNYILVYRYEN